MPEITHRTIQVDLTMAQQRELRELELTEANPLVYYEEGASSDLRGYLFKQETMPRRER